MKLETFFESFAPLADAPNGVQKLRELILQLAVRGKLVPQDARDEPAAVLLAKIKAEKERLMWEKKIKKSEPLPPIEDDEVPFDLPNGWEWVRLQELGEFCGGMTPSTNRSDYWNGEVPWVSPKDMKSLRIKSSELSITELGLNETRLRLLPKHSVLIVARSGILKRTLPVAVNEIECTVNQDIKVVIPHLTIISDYLQLMLRGHEAIILKELVKGGMTVQSLKYDEFEVYPFPFPPLAEQRRIVAKVDQLMALCDELEVRQQRQQTARIKLNNATLEGLLTASTPAEFAEHWQRICDNFDLLYDAPATVAALRQAILQLAVQGKLVPQDAHDEPAAVLLAKVKAEKERLMQEKKIKKVATLPTIETDEAPFDLPEGWEWIRLGSICELENGDRSTNYPSRSEFVANGIPFINAGHLQLGKVCLDSMNYIPESRFNLLKSGKVRNGDILFCLRGSLGKSAIVSNISKGAIASSLVIVRLIAEMDDHFVLNYLFSPLAMAMIKRFDNGTAQPNLSSADLGKFMFPLPPLAEQRRIVAKVDQLMALCDELEAKLRQAQTASAKLMTATVQHLAAA